MRFSLRWPVAVVVLLSACMVANLPAQQRQRDREADPDARQDERSEQRQREGERDRGDLSREGTRQSDTGRLLPPRPDRDRYWHLGVDVDYRDFGGQINRVERRSAAERAGLEVRDVIVTVNGYQVGRVNGRLYTLNRELELRADRRGQVTLLVQNHRNGQLAPLSVRLEPAERQRDPLRSQSIIGTISSQRFSSLARGAVLTVRLLDITDRRLPARMIAQRSYRELGPLPIPFELSYETDRIMSGRKYALDAEVTVNGLATFRTSKRYPVLDTERQGRVNMVLEPARR